MKTMAELHAYFKDLEAKEKYSGVVLLTRGAERLFTEAYGYANRAWKIRNTLSTRFDTASVTKLFTSAAVFQLIDQGYISLQSPVIDFLGITDTSISKEVNVFHLLTHSSGIGDDAEEEDNESYEDLWKEKPNYAVTKTADFLPQFIHKPPNFSPGQGCRYNNCGYILLGLMIEKITGMDYRAYVKENIFVRAGMNHSDFLRMDRVNKNVAEGCDPISDNNDHIIGWKKNIYSFPPIGSPDSGAYVTASDLNRFLRAVKRGRLLSPKATETFLTPQIHYRHTKDYEAKYGFGLLFYLDKQGKVVCYQKEGVNAGVSAVIRHFPGQDITVVLLSNMEDGVWDPIWFIHEMVVEGKN
ncbi:MAG: beta-lactamase family protein [Anaerolineales bacterium]|nr:beta-lactamase family protein [Anaerolineales bacterium]